MKPLVGIWLCGLCACNAMARELPVYREFSRDIRFSQPMTSEAALDRQQLQILREAADMEHIGGASPLFAISFGPDGSLQVGAGASKPMAYVPPKDSTDSPKNLRYAKADRQWLANSLNLSAFGQTSGGTNSSAPTTLWEREAESGRDLDWLAQELAHLATERKAATPKVDESTQELQPEHLALPDVLPTVAMEQMRNLPERISTRPEGIQPAGYAVSPGLEQKAAREIFAVEESEAMKIIAGLAASGMGDLPRLELPAYSPLPDTQAAWMPEKNSPASSSLPAASRQHSVAFPSTESAPSGQNSALRSTRMESPAGTVGWQSGWKAKGFTPLQLDAAPQPLAPAAASRPTPLENMPGAYRPSWH